MYAVRVRRSGHLIAGALAIVVLPALSWLDGSGQLAWTMFARTSQYRLEINALSREGTRRPIGPTELAASIGKVPAAVYLSGAESWRTHNIARVTLRRHLREVAALACRTSGAARVELTLWQRRNLDAKAFSTIEHFTCGD